jgi:DNA-binding response OmpR family regulator
VLTAARDGVTDIDLLAVGADAQMTKSFSSRELLAPVDRLLRPRAPGQLT